MASNALSLFRDDQEHLSEMDSPRRKTAWLPDTGKQHRLKLSAGSCKALVQAGPQAPIPLPRAPRMAGTEQEQVLMKCWSS